MKFDMKAQKLIYFIFGSLLMVLTACENLLDAPPAPTEKIDNETYTFSESFRNSLGAFTVYSDSGKQSWAVTNNSNVMMAGKVDNVSYANVDWLISPSINIPANNTSVLTFDYVVREFGDLTNDATVWVSEDYNKDSIPTKATWTKLSLVEPMVNAANWNMTNAGSISLKAFKGKKINIAFQYKSSNTTAGTWQIKNFIIKDRKPVSIPYLESFTVNKGKFTSISVSGAESWSFDSFGKYLKMTGHVGSANLVNEDWLISPQIDLTKVSTAKLTFDHVARYFKNNTDATVWISENYEEGLPETAVWTKLPTLPFVDPGSWPKVLPSAGEISLTPYAGKTVTIAFKYVSNTINAGTWELKNISIQEGEAKVIEVGKGTEANPYTVAGGKLYQNTSAWVKGYVVGYAWAGASGTIYTFSADSCTQATNILIADSAHIKEPSKCMAVQLPTGAVRDGLSLVTNKLNLGKLISLYGSLEAYFGFPGIKNTSYYVLPDGTAGGTRPVEPIYSETFASNSQGNFTINNVVAPTAIPSIWLTSASYGMIATGFKSPTNYATEAWLISPEIDLTTQATAKMRFDHAINFVTIANIKNEMTLHISTDNGVSWAPLTIPTYPAGNTWTFVSSGEINLSSYIGGKIKVAFKYLSTTTKAGTWEVKNFVVYK